MIQSRNKEKTVQSIPVIITQTKSKGNQGYYDVLNEEDESKPVSNSNSVISYASILKIEAPVQKSINYVQSDYVQLRPLTLRNSKSWIEIMEEGSDSE
jgi:hypothetical protein